jgi:hypothetical protein
MQTCVEYVSNHKKEILLGALCTVGAGVLIALGVKSLGSTKEIAKPAEIIGDIVSDSNEWVNRNVVEGFTTGKVNDLWNEGDYGTAIVTGFKLEDMGKLGEDLKKIKGVTDETPMEAVLTFVNTKVAT